MAEEDIVVSDRVTIPGGELSFRFSRSSGAGGQNVNKVNSKAELVWNVAESEALPPAVRARFLKLARSYLTTSGEIHIASQVFRDQPRNIERCRERLSELIAKALIPPKPRKKTKPSKAAKQRRLTAKKARGQTKKTRKYRHGDDA